jgi:hypothetical protein
VGGLTGGLGQAGEQPKEEKPKEEKPKEKKPKEEKPKETEEQPQPQPQQAQQPQETGGGGGPLGGIGGLTDTVSETLKSVTDTTKGIGGGLLPDISVLSPTAEAGAEAKSDQEGEKKKAGGGRGQKKTQQPQQ